MLRKHSTKLHTSSFYFAVVVLVFLTGSHWVGQNGFKFMISLSLPSADITEYATMPCPAAFLEPFLVPVDMIWPVKS
jgi:hypothetical protein